MADPEDEDAESSYREVPPHPKSPKFVSAPESFLLSRACFSSPPFFLRRRQNLFPPLLRPLDDVDRQRLPSLLYPFNEANLRDLPAKYQILGSLFTGKSLVITPGDPPPLSFIFYFALF